MTNCRLLHILRSAICAAAVLSCLAFLPAHPAGAQRLPTNVIPTHYTLKLAPDLKTATFTGTAKIDVNIMQATSAITLNAAELKFDSVEIYANGPRQAGTVSLDAGKQQATFTFPNAISAGSATLIIHYSGILNNELRGFYLSKTAHRNYAVTQFEPTDARRAFPCFDEPAFKAAFAITLVVDKGDTAISNGRIVSDTPGPGSDKHTLEFSETPKMSTYLVAFLVGDFQCTGGASDGVSIRSCSTPDQVKYTPYALSVAKFVIHYYDNYFGIPYPLKKLDLIAIPDFEAGAMENFGCITFRETAMLLDPKNSTIAQQENVSVDIAHEMAHQWFGDMVTMEWWNNIWLNEGFATWMENKPVAAMHPEWHMPQVVAADEQSTLNLDAQPTTHAIRAPLANTPAEINQLFDGISYGKASDVLLAVENYLGEETFRRGVHAYLEAHKFSNATAQDFWNAQAATSQKPVDQIMESLVVQPGEPILSFGTPSGGQVPVEQRRFFLNPTVQADANEKWTLPVCFVSGAAGDRASSQAQGDASQKNCEVLTPSTTSLKIPSSSLFYANVGGRGYYRTSYQPAQYQALVAAVETGLTPTERISAAGDEWARVRANQATVGDYLDLVEALKNDPNAVVISSAVSPISAIYEEVSSNSRERKQLAAWVRRTFGPAYEKLGPPLPGATPNDQQLRASLFALLGYIGEDPAVLKQARELANQYLDNPASVPPTLAQTALAVAAEKGGPDLFDKLQKIYETSPNPEFQESALRLLAEFQNPALEERALNYAISGKVRNQDAAIQFAIGIEDPDTRDAAWQFVQGHWDQVHALLTPEMGEILVESTGYFCSAAAHDDVQTFFATHTVEDASDYLKHSLEHIDGCVELRSAQGPNLEKWLAAHPAS